MDIVCFLFSLALFILAFQIMQMQASMGQTSPSLRLPMQYAYAGLAVGGLFMAVRFVLHLCRYFKPDDSQEF
jgi:TRAP-type C4-dicarboxylate transport system permease small subunit